MQLHIILHSWEISRCRIKGYLREVEGDCHRTSPWCNRGQKYNRVLRKLKNVYQAWMLLAWEGVLLPWVEAMYPMKSYFVNDTTEVVASIHGGIHERQHHQSFEKKHNLPQQMSFSEPTWNFCETGMLFQTSGYHMYSRGYVVLQTSNRAKFEKNQEIVTCPMYVPSTCTKTVVCTRHGAGQFSCEDSFRCMWPVTHALITRLSSGAISVNSSSCSKSKDNGRYIDVDEQLVIQWMCGATALDSVLQRLFSMCRRSWELPSCICLNNEVNCAKLCKIADQSK